MRVRSRQHARAGVSRERIAHLIWHDLRDLYTVPRADLQETHDLYVCMSQPTHLYSTGQGRLVFTGKD